MSVYSGFGTRQEESAYNALVENTIKLLQSKVVSNLKSPSLPDPLFKIHLLKNFEMMIKLEKHKYLDPKFSEAFRKVIVKIVKDQARLTLEKRENLTRRKSFTSSNTNGIAERSATPTLSVTKTQSKFRTHTPIQENRGDTGFLFARLKRTS